MGDQKNKHELSRYVPPNIKRQIRENSGYGCVICGGLLIQYDHVDPEFKDAKVHDPNRMTLLCVDHHDRKTKRLISQKYVLEAMKHPKAKTQGFVNDILYVDTSRKEVIVGELRIRNFEIVLCLSNKPLLWFEFSSNDSIPTNICAIFRDQNNKPIAFINRNEFIALVGNLDITSVARALTIKDQSNNCILELERTGDEPLRVVYFESAYNRFRILVDDKNGIRYGDSDLPINKLKQIYGSGTLFGYGNKSIAFELTHEYREQISYLRSKIQVAVLVSLYAKKVKDVSGCHVGWVLSIDDLSLSNYFRYMIGFDRIIIDFANAVVGYYDYEKVFTPSGEFVGYWNGNNIHYPNIEYENREPIFTYPAYRTGKSVYQLQSYDVSFRFFGFFRGLTKKESDDSKKYSEEIFRNEYPHLEKYK